jgi:catechol 2,3-dioxygenase-like lactoylglutathione lyase family enzyme
VRVYLIEEEHDVATLTMWVDETAPGHERFGREAMTIRLDHTIVPAKDRIASATFFAEIFGLTVEPDPGHFAGVQVNESLTFDFADEPEEWGGPGFDPRTGRSHHYAFHVSDPEFDAIFGRLKAKGISYGSDPFSHTNGRINTRRGGRGLYFEDPYGHLLEIMTVPETAGAPAGKRRSAPRTRRGRAAK